MILREGYKNILFFFILAIFFFLIFFLFNFYIFIFFSILCIIMSIFSVYFFRNPKRNINISNENILAPCDGKIIEIVKKYNDILGENCYVIRIFMSIFNIHVQRAPISGFIKKIEYIKGKFLSALNKNACIENEQLKVLFINKDDNNKKVLCIQIAGLIAKNIVNWKKENEFLNIGEIYGMIKFGSQVDIFFSEDSVLNVHENQNVFAGRTILAKW